MSTQLIETYLHSSVATFCGRGPGGHQAHGSACRRPKSTKHPTPRETLYSDVSLLLLLVVNLLAAAQLTGAAGGNETDLLARHGVALHGRRVTDVLMVSSTVRVLNWVHRNTTDLRPAVTLGLVLVESTASLQQRFVNASTTGNNANDSARHGRDGLLLSRGEAHTCLASALNVTNDLRKAARRLRESALVSGVLLDVVDDGARGHVLQGDAVARNQVSCAHEPTTKLRSVTVQA